MPGFKKCRSESLGWPMGRVSLGVGVLGIALALGGCEDRVLEQGFGYEYMKGYLEPLPPPPDTPPPVRQMTDRNPDYPSLYTVPMRAAPIPSPAERKQALADEQKAVERLQVDQRAGHSADEQLQEVAPPPLPVPPPPDGVAKGKQAKGPTVQGTGGGTVPAR